MRPSEIVQRGVRDITAQLKEIKQAEEDDLAKAAQSFDAVATSADRIAAQLSNADKALSDDGSEQQDEEQEGEEDEQEEDSPE